MSSPEPLVPLNRLGLGTSNVQVALWTRDLIGWIVTKGVRPAIFYAAWLVRDVNRLFVINEYGDLSVFSVRLSVANIDFL